VVSGRSGITPEMAVRLSKAVGNDPDFWLRLQRQYDVAQVLKEARRIKVVPFSKLAREKARGVVRARALRAALPRSGFEAREIDAMKREGRP
jgi:hypothetical protein